MLQGFENEKNQTPRKMNTGSFLNSYDLNISQFTDREKYEIMIQNEENTEHQISQKMMQISSNFIRRKLIQSIEMKLDQDAQQEEHEKYD